MSNIIISKVPTKTVIRNGKVVQEHVYPPSAEGTFFADIPYNKFAEGGVIPDGDEPEKKSSGYPEYNTEYASPASGILQFQSPPRREMPPEDYRFVDSDTYKITHPEKWYGYQGGTKLDNKWYWQRKDGKWVDEDNNVIGYYLGMPGARSQTLSVKEHNKKVNEFLQRIPSHVKNVFNVSGIGPLIEEHIRKQLEQIQEGEMPEIKNTGGDFVSFDPNIPATLQREPSNFLYPTRPLRESYSSKKLLNKFKYEGRGIYNDLFNQVPRPAAVYTESDLSAGQLIVLDSLVRSTFKRHNGYYPNVLLGDTLNMPIEDIDYKALLGDDYGKNSGFIGTLYRAIDPKSSIETSIGAVGPKNLRIYNGGYTLEDTYDFNTDQAHYKDSQMYGNMSMDARRGGFNSEGTAETDKDHDIFKQRFLIRRKFNNNTLFNRND